MEKIPPELFNAVYLIFDDCVKWNEFIHKQKYAFNLVLRVLVIF